MAEQLDVMKALDSVARRVFVSLRRARGDGEERADGWPGEPPLAEFVRALGAAIYQYATDGRLALAGPLFAEGEFDLRRLPWPLRGLVDPPPGVLNDEEVAAELAALVGRLREPDARLVGERWRECMESPPANVDFEAEAGRLLAALRDELENASAHDAHTADAGETAWPVLTERLLNLRGLLGSEFARLARRLLEAPPQVRRRVRDFTRFVEEKTRGFVGRDFVFDSFDEFMMEQPRGGCFVVRGTPGVGKSALAAQLVRRRGYVHHFNVRSEGVNKPEQFLWNVSAQLAAAYVPGRSSLPSETPRDGHVLSELLYEASVARGDDKLVVVIDGLDEVEPVGTNAGNPLHLPLTLPRNVFLFLTTRITDEQLPFDPKLTRRLDITQDSRNWLSNLGDVREYVSRRTGRPGIRVYIDTHGLDSAQFVEHLAYKSEGNFMYLRYVLPEIERGAYRDLELESIPAGLRNYYEDHWRRMRGKDEEAWFAYKLPVVMALTVVKEPISVELISDFSGVKDLRLIQSVIEEWRQFLHCERVEVGGSRQWRYRIYHSSFHDFIESKEEVRGEGVSRREAHARIADNLWAELFGNG